MKNKRCSGYCGVACVNGYCPVSNSDEYIAHGVDSIRDCEDCYFYKGCDDCAFVGTVSCAEVIDKE